MWLLWSGKKIIGVSSYKQCNIKITLLTLPIRRYTNNKARASASPVRLPLESQFVLCGSVYLWEAFQTAWTGTKLWTWDKDIWYCIFIFQFVAWCTLENIIIIIIIIKLNANWWAWELEPSKIGGGPAEIQGTAGRFHANHIKGNQPCTPPPTSTITLKKLSWPDTANRFLWGVGRRGSCIDTIGDQSDPQSSTEQANSK